MKKLAVTLILLIFFSAAKSQTGRSIKEAHGLPVGAKAPLFTAMDADSNSFNLEKAIHQKPVVLIFYRGFWCPVCNKHLGSIQDSLAMIEATGAKVIAISPEKPDYLNKMADQTGAQFTLLYDEGYLIADAYDVTFKPTSTQLFTYNVVLGAKLKDTHSDQSQQLPIPATFIIDQKGKIHWRQFNPDYKKRASVKDILKALDEL